MGINSRETLTRAVGAAETTIGLGVAWLGEDLFRTGQAESEVGTLTVKLIGALFLATGGVASVKGVIEMITGIPRQIFPARYPNQNP
ncbi:MAG: hypothetical protein JO026_03875 [Patescibacteria group bacterium]|nr:hypothetical protein [Patescibacteria group bacterium]